jgi:hypothetical protein
MSPRNLLLVTALAASSSAMAQDVAVLGASPNTDAILDVVASLQTTGRLLSVNYFDVGQSTPTLTQLNTYQSVLVFSDGIAFQDKDLLGDTLADYVDSGRGVVVAGDVFIPGFEIGGRWATGTYSPFSVDGTLSVGTGPSQLHMQLVEGAHATVQYTVRVYGGIRSQHAAGLSVINSSVLVSNWVDVTWWPDGQPTYIQPFVAFKAFPTKGDVVGLNFLPVSSDYYPDSWFIETDGEHLMASSLLWSAGFLPSCLNTTLIQDINCNAIDVSDEGVVDLSDPTCFEYYTAKGWGEQDYFYIYSLFGCSLAILDENVLPPAQGDPPADGDEDGFSYHKQIVFDPSVIDPFAVPGTYPTGPGRLFCDNCPTVYNPEQGDGDCDNHGDECDLCPTIPEPNTDPMIQQDNDCFGMCPDGVGDPCDNCILINNPDQSDVDFDLVGDACDNCPRVFNPDQSDQDGDFLGDACDNCPEDQNEDQADNDDDGAGDACDNCQPGFVVDPGKEFNPGQDNSDGDIFGDACDNCRYIDNVIIDFSVEPPLVFQEDDDLDGVGNECDNCLEMPNTLQLDNDLDGVGNLCDNCPDRHNLEQADADRDGLGNACDNCVKEQNPGQADVDGDKFGDTCDNCPQVFNDEQLDRDQDGVGDVCDLCPLVFEEEQRDSDGDGIGDECDNCRNLSNPDQADADNNGYGDPCDIQVRGSGVKDCSITSDANCVPSGGTCSQTGSSAAWLGLGLALAALRRAHHPLRARSSGNTLGDRR